jgi:hypothetical protein
LLPKLEQAAKVAAVVNTAKLRRYEFILIPYRSCKPAASAAGVLAVGLLA